jgi:hypothetical protein
MWTLTVGRGYAAGLDPVLHHAGVYHSMAKKRPGSSSISFERRLVVNRPGTARTESRVSMRPGTGRGADSRMSSASVRKEFVWPEFH